MALIIENGSGIASANGYASDAFVLAYLTDRARETEGLWSTAATADKEAAIIKATDYIETRFGQAFKGLKEFLSLKNAKATFSTTANPLDTETIVIGSVTYTFNTALGGANSILIGVNASISLDNLLAAINGETGEGTTYGTGTVAHPDASAEVFEDDAIVVSAKVEGVAGNAIISTTTVTGGSWTSATLTGGTDTGRPQPLSFPRYNLLDGDGICVVGIPLKLKQATAEYAVRGILAVLAPDPSDTGHIIRKKEKVDVIEQETEYSESGPLIGNMQEYPAADKLLAEYISSSSRVIRA